MVNFCEQKVTFLVAQSPDLELSLNSLLKNAPKHFSFVGLSSREDFLPLRFQSRVFKALPPPIVNYSDVLYFSCPGGAFRFQSLLDDLNFYYKKNSQNSVIIDETNALITATDIACEQGVSDFYGRFKKLTNEELQTKMRIQPDFEGSKIALSRKIIEDTRSPKLDRHAEFIPFLKNVKDLVKKLLGDGKSGLIVVNSNGKYPFENSVGLALHNCGLDTADVHKIFTTNSDIHS